MSIWNKHPSLRQSTTQMIATGLVLPGGVSILGVLRSIADYLATWDEQELTGTVAGADNVKVDLGRDVAPEDFTEWTGTPAITDLGSNVAHWDGTAGTQNLFIQSPPSPEGMQNKIWRFTFTVSNYVGGAIGSRVGDTAGNSYSADGTYIDEYTAVGNNDTILLAGNSFEGDVDLKLVEVQQTDILASSAYPGAEELANSGNPFVFTVPDAPDNYTVNKVGDATSNVIENPSGHIQLISDGTSANIRQDVMTVGLRYRLAAIVSAYDSGPAQMFEFSDAAEIIDIDSVGAHSLELTADGAGFYVQRKFGTACDMSFSSYSVKRANPPNGDHSGVAVGQTGQYNIPIMAEYDGIASKTDKTSAEYNSSYTPDEFTRAIVFRKTTWDATERWIFQDWVDANNFIGIRDSTTAGTIEFVYKTGGVEKVVSWVSGSPTDSKLLDLSVSGGVMEGRVNGVSQGTIAIGAAIVGNFAVNMLGAENDGTNVHLGFLAYDQHYTSKTTDADMVRVTNSMGIPS